MSTRMAQVACTRCGVTFLLHVDADHEFKTPDLKVAIPMSGLPASFPAGADGADMDPDHTPEAMIGLADTPDLTKEKLRAAVRGDDAWRHPDMIDDIDTLGPPVDYIDLQIAAENFMTDMGMTPTPDAVGQMLEVFVPCLRIMCDRGYDPTGGLWRKAGILGIIWDVRKKFERLWYRTWTLGIRHDDSGFDLINFTGMLLRSDPNSRFGDAGEPAGEHSRKSNEPNP